MSEYQYYFKENKKVKKAVALSYEAGEKAPKIVATGKGELAEKIVKKIKSKDILVKLKST